MIGHQSLLFPHQSLAPDSDFQHCPRFLQVFYFHTGDMFFDQVRYDDLRTTVCVLPI